MFSLLNSSIGLYIMNITNALKAILLFSLYIFMLILMHNIVYKGKKWKWTIFVLPSIFGVAISFLLYFFFPNMQIFDISEFKYLSGLKFNESINIYSNSIAIFIIVLSTGLFIAYQMANLLKNDKTSPILNDEDIEKIRKLIRDEIMQANEKILFELRKDKDEILNAIINISKNNETFVKDLLDDGSKTFKLDLILDELDKIRFQMMKESKHVSVDITRKPDYLQYKISESIEINRQIASIAHLIGRLDMAKKAIDNILENNPNDLDAINRKGIYYLSIDSYLDAMEEFKLIEISSIDNNNKEGLAIAYGNIGLTYLNFSNFPKAEEYINKSKRISESMGDLYGIASNLLNLGQIFAIQGEIQKATDSYNESLALIEKTGDRQLKSVFYANIGHIHAITNNLMLAKEMFFNAIAIDNDIEWREGLSANFGNLGNVFGMLGEFDKAEEYFFKALEIENELDRKHGKANALGGLGIIYSLTGEFQKAETYLMRALKIHEELKRKNEIALCYGNLGNLHMNKTDPDFKLAKEYFENALDIFKAINNQSGMANTYVNLGQLFILLNQRNLAIDNWMKACDIFEKMGLTFAAKELQLLIEEIQ